MATPTRYLLVVGRGEGESELTAFDAALLDAGVANLNLLRVTSIMPPGAVPMVRCNIPPGSLVPAAYGTLASSVPGSVISAAVAVGFNSSSFGIIMEHTEHGTQEEVEFKIRSMVREAFRKRGMVPDDIAVKSVEHTVESLGCVFAAAILWY